MTNSLSNHNPTESADDAVYIAALHVGISRDATRRLLGTLKACGLTIAPARLSPPVPESAPLTPEQIEDLRQLMLRNVPHPGIGTWDKPNTAPAVNALCDMALRCSQLEAELATRPTVADVCGVLGGQVLGS